MGSFRLSKLAVVVVAGWLVVGCGGTEGTGPAAPTSAAPTAANSSTKTTAPSPTSTPSLTPSGATEEPVDQADGSDEGQAAESSPPASANTSSAPAITSADLVVALRSVKVAGQTTTPLIVSGVPFSQSLQQATEQLTISPKGCRVTGYGLGTVATDSTPAAGRVHSKTAFGLSALALPNEKAAKQWITQRNGEVKRCGDVVITTEGNQIPVTIRFSSTAATVHDGQRMSMSINGQLVSKQITGRKGRVVFVVSAQNAANVSTSTMEQAATDLFKALP